ncbi:BrnT family toxin [Zavarzinia sp. CC-PAN008]|uniref:BrnT family toxin n=1 Tax=Zavarzinia sp. CC-PAN008 TaxID=3243332 RepID=UPI003F746A67
MELGRSEAPGQHRQARRRLADCERFDLDTALIEFDDDDDKGEVRLTAIGSLDLRIYFLIFVERDGINRAISLRTASPHEVSDMSEDTGMIRLRALAQAQLDAMSEDEAVRLAAAAEADPDTPRRTRPADAGTIARVRAKAGRPAGSGTKEQVTVR